jgi:chemotaxis protein MotB
MGTMCTGDGAARVTRRYGWLLTVAALLVGTTACVSSGKYDEMAAEREALQAERDAITAQLGELERKVGAIEDLNRDLGSQLEARQAEIAAMQGTHDSLLRSLETELESGQIQIEQLRNGIRVNVAEEILFPSGSAELNERGSDLLAKVAADIKSAAHRVEVLGHTDKLAISGRLKSRYPTNWELGAARSTRVVRLFQEQGIDGARLAAVSRGPFAPIASNDTEDGRAQNRRIEIRLMPAASTPATPASD